MERMWGLPLSPAAHICVGPSTPRSTSRLRRRRRRRRRTDPLTEPYPLPPARNVPDEILEEIFLRLDAAEDLARASAACTTFRRVVSARRFLHRFRCLHPPPVLGFLEFDALGTFHPAEPPHRAAPAARALAEAADFTFSFLGTRHCWRVCDARDSRVLLYRRTSITAAFADLMVCDPLHRRHVELPAIPDDLAAATGGSGMQEFDAFLDPDSDNDKEKQDLSFRVICAVQCQHKLVTFHFSSVTGQWRSITFNRTIPFDYSLVKYQYLFERHYAHGCYFWTTALGGSFMVMLNMHDMELSVVDLPPVIFCPREQAIVEAGEGMIGLFKLRDDMLQLFYKSLRGTEWHHERIMGEFTVCHYKRS
ncbi:uncharacterized protein [Miscanthus floridulus]|uniref:uncharacterized protein n=1 Tax=Miscanthus floridulus TaxID=154761 RepID=UPI003457EA64